MFEQPNYQPDRSNEQKESDLGLLLPIFNPSSDYCDFFANLGKYTDEITIQGFSGDPRKIISQIHFLNKLIFELLQAASSNADFLEAGNQSVAFLAKDIQSSSLGFWTKQGLDVTTLTKMVAWALDAWRILGDRYGRPCTLKKEDIARIMPPLERSLNTCNAVILRSLNKS